MAREFCQRAIVSNLTAWDTYGKLVGLNRTPPEIKKNLNALRGAGAYVVYASMEESAVSRLPGERMLVKDGEGEFTMAVSSSQTAPPGKRAVTFTCRTEVDSGSHISRARKTTSSGTRRRWSSSGIDCTRRFRSSAATSRSSKPQTRAPTTTNTPQTRDGFRWTARQSRPRFLPNLFIIGDTVSSAPKLDSVVESAILLATDLARIKTDGHTCVVVYMCTDNMFVTVDERDARPLYQQLVDEIKTLIARGDSRKGRCCRLFARSRPTLV